MGTGPAALCGVIALPGPRSGTCSATLSPHLSLCSFVFLQLYHSPFFGDESNKPILLPNEVGMPFLPCRGSLEPGVRAQWDAQLWVVVALTQACRGLQPQLPVAACGDLPGRGEPSLGQASG